MKKSDNFKKVKIERGGMKIEDPSQNVQVYSSDHFDVVVKLKPTSESKVAHDLLRELVFYARKPISQEYLNVLNKADNWVKMMDSRPLTAANIPERP